MISSAVPPPPRREHGDRQVAAANPQTRSASSAGAHHSRQVLPQQCARGPSGRSQPRDRPRREAGREPAAPARAVVAKAAAAADSERGVGPHHPDVVHHQDPTAGSMARPHSAHVSASIGRTSSRPGSSSAAAPGGRRPRAPPRGTPETDLPGAPQRRHGPCRVHPATTSTRATTVRVTARARMAARPCSTRLLRSSATPSRCSASTVSRTQMAPARRHGPVASHPPERRKVHSRTLNRMTNWPRSSLYWISARRVTGAGKSKVTSARENASARRSAPNTHVHSTMAPHRGRAGARSPRDCTSAAPEDGRCRTPTAQR